MPVKSLDLQFQFLKCLVNTLKLKEGNAKSHFFKNKINNLFIFLRRCLLRFYTE